MASGVWIVRFKVSSSSTCSSSFAVGVSGVRQIFFVLSQNMYSNSTGEFSTDGRPEESCCQKMEPSNVPCSCSSTHLASSRHGREYSLIKGYWSLWALWDCDCSLCHSNCKYPQETHERKRQAAWMQWSAPCRANTMDPSKTKRL